MKNSRPFALFIALCIFIGFVWLYTQTRTVIHTFDALSYTQDVENKPLLELYHPHHLLYGVVGYGVVDMAESIGYEGRADQPIQALNALAGALGVVLLWGFGAAYSGKVWHTLPMALLMGLSYAYWFYASEVEVYTVAAVFIVACLWVLVRLEQTPTWQWAVALGLAHAGAVMFHQTNALFLIPVSLFIIMLPYEIPLKGRVLVIYGATLAVAVGVPYLGVGWQSGFRDVDGYYNWLTDYAQQGTWGSNLSLDSLSALREGLLDTISLTPIYGVVFYGLAIVGALLTRWRRSWLVLVISWLVLYGGFFWWWEPWNIEFWIVLLPLWAILMFGGATSARATARTSPAPPALAVVALVLAGLLVWEHYGVLRENTRVENDYYQQVTTALAPSLNEQDVVITRGNILDLYLPFYANHPASKVLSARQQSLDSILNTIRQAHVGGNLIYIDNLLLDEPLDGQRNPFGLTPETIEQIQAQYPITPTINYNGAIVFYSIGERTPPTTTEWIFSEHLAGWTAFGAANPRFESAGWCFTGGGDPWLESPPLSIDTQTITQVTIDLSLDGDAEYGQLFWHRPNEGLSEERSLRFSLESDRQTYTLDLSGQVGWQETIVFLRFDPIPENLDATACVYGIQLEPQE